jgi:FkbM family methyltransferase
MLDYSQWGQALILGQLASAGVPQILVDIGAHDGVCGSNSRAFLEQGWEGLLVEPMPAVFAKLRENCASLPRAVCRQAACSDRSGRATLRIGTDGPLGQMSSLSPDPEIAPNLSPDTVEVDALTLPELLAQHAIPDLFGILLVDTEGWDLTVLRSLAACHSRPEIIVTEDYQGTNLEKNRFLTELGYTNAGNWGSDSIWVAARLAGRIAELHYPVHPVAALPLEQASQSGRAYYDANVSGPSGRGCWTLAGWAWTRIDVPPPSEIILTLESRQQTRHFQAWRTPRPDVARAFDAPSLFFSGFRSYVAVPPGCYAVCVTQVDSETHTVDLGEIDIGRSFAALV